MNILLNGKTTTLEKTCTLEALLDFFKFDRPSIAVAVNFSVITRSEFPNITIKDGDTVEILNPTAGG